MARPAIGPAKEIRFTDTEWRRLETMGAATGHTATGQVREIVRLVLAAIDTNAGINPG